MSINSALNILDVNDDMLVDGELNPILAIVNDNINSVKFAKDTVYQYIDSEDRVRIISSRFGRLVTFTTDRTGYKLPEELYNSMQIELCFHRKFGRCYRIEFIDFLFDGIGNLYIREDFTKAWFGTTFEVGYTKLKESNNIQAKVYNFMIMYAPKIFLGYSFGMLAYSIMALIKLFF